jgi:hypothetical protein
MGGVLMDRLRTSWWSPLLAGSLALAGVPAPAAPAPAAADEARVVAWLEGLGARLGRDPGPPGGPVVAATPG